MNNVGNSSSSQEKLTMHVNIMDAFRGVRGDLSLKTNTDREARKSLTPINILSTSLVEA